MNLFKKLISVPGLTVQSEQESSGQPAPERTEHLVTAAEPDASGCSAAEAVAAERKRVSSILAVARPGQEELRDKLVASGTDALEAVLALSANAKTLPAPVATLEVREEPKEKITEAGIAAEMFKMISASARPPVQTSAQPDRDIKAEFAAIKDPKEAEKFFEANREALVNSKININLNKEG
jgi:hypothetical protein